MYQERGPQGGFNHPHLQWVVLDPEICLQDEPPEQREAVPAGSCAGRSLGPSTFPHPLMIRQMWEPDLHFGDVRRGIIKSKVGTGGWSREGTYFFAPMKPLSGAVSVSGSKDHKKPVVTSTALNPHAGNKVAPRLRNAGRAEERVKS